MKKLETEIQHFEPLEVHPSNRPLVYPIYQSAKFEYDTYEGFLQPRPDGFFYSRISNPTVRQLELLLAKIQNRDDAIAFASGVSSLAVSFLALVQAGDHVIFFAESYAPSRYLLRDLLGKFGISHTMLFYDQLNSLGEHVRPNTRFIHFESPTNPSLTVPDISKIVNLSREKGIITILDNTLAGFHQHGEFEIDLYCHSLTKYASGHGDAMGGVVIGKFDLIKKLRTPAINLGSTLDPHTAYLILRGMKTYFIRYRQQCENALKIAQYLENHNKINKVIYPGLESHPDHQLAQKQMKEFGSIVSIELKDSVDQNKFVSRLKYFRVVGSLGSTESLIVPSKRLFGADLDSEQQVRAQLKDNSFRLSVGIEAVEDLIQDLELALL